jgi:rhamnosyltransferase
VPDTLVVLSTFNGERFLADQLESLRRSTFKDWTLFVRDDGSTDRTLTVVERFVAADSRIRTLATNDGRLGPAQSYGRLLAEAVETGAKYVFLCDQDDVWLTEKMGRQIEQVNAAERRFGPETPLLLHTDLAVVDEGLRLIHSSFLASQRLRHQARRPLETLAVQNFATGCTMLVNRALLEVALPIPYAAVMHDWCFVPAERGGFSSTHNRPFFIGSMKPTRSAREVTGQTFGTCSQGDVDATVGNLRRSPTNSPRC